MYGGAWVSQHVELSWRADRCAWKEHTTKFWTIHRSVTSILAERCPVLRHGSNARDSSSPTARSSPNEWCRPNRGRCVLPPVGTRGGVGWMRGPCAQYCSNKENLSVYGRASINRIERAIAHI